jgi:2,3-bisphosphoglycerate-independent phosphoglycerate mutase
MGRKFAIVIPDGAADEPQEALGGLTPLEAAATPHMDRVAAAGIVGLAHNVPEPFIPGSDVAALSLLGYDPFTCYTGRAPLEAAAQGIHLGPHDWAIRCNLVTVRDEKMEDFSAGHISSEEARELMASLAERLGSRELEFRAGVSYRNLLIYRGHSASPAPFSEQTRTTPPHEIPDQPVEAHRPTGPGSELLCKLMDESRAILAHHPVNRRRVEMGKRPATQIWLWGLGKAPQLGSFQGRFGLSGAMITAVDLLRGIARLLGWTCLEVPGATGYLDTNYRGKGEAAVRALEHYDIVCVHIEAPDEASHEGRLDAKIQSLEEIDRWIVGPLADALLSGPFEGRLLVSPDHPTPLRTRTHGRGYVPWAMAGFGLAPSQRRYGESAASQSPYRYERGHELMPFFLGKA